MTTDIELQELEEVWRSDAKAVSCGEEPSHPLPPGVAREIVKNHGKVVQIEYRINVDVLSAHQRRHANFIISEVPK